MSDDILLAVDQGSKNQQIAFPPFHPELLWVFSPQVLNYVSRTNPLMCFQVDGLSKRDAADCGERH